MILTYIIKQLTQTASICKWCGENTHKRPTSLKCRFNKKNALFDSDAVPLFQMSHQ